jgi:hypothetical protein
VVSAVTEATSRDRVTAAVTAAVPVLVAVNGKVTKSPGTKPEKTLTPADGVAPLVKVNWSVAAPVKLLRVDSGTL